jgi:hypothetical protein
VCPPLHAHSHTHKYTLAQTQKHTHTYTYALPGGLNPRAFRRRHLKLPRAMGGGDTYGPQGPPEGMAAGEEWSAHERKNSLIAETGER